MTRPGPTETGTPRTTLAILSTESAYRVPWRFDRGNGIYVLRNLGAETLTGVTFVLRGPGIMPASLPVTLDAGDVLEIAISGHDLARATLGVIRWFRPDGQEYLWRVAF
jgi:hypothetical protein